MLLVKTYLASSKIHGIGLFVAEFIPKGTKDWEFNPKIDLEFTEDEMQKLPSNIRDYFIEYAHRRNDGTYVFCADNARFCNHSENPNTKFFEDATPYSIVMRDIQKGEELTINYKDFDSDARSGNLGYVTLDND